MARVSDLISTALALLLFGGLGVDVRASDLVGHVYIQTNETQNRIMHFGRNADGQLELLESIPTGGAGSGVCRRPRICAGEHVAAKRASAAVPTTARKHAAPQLIGSAVPL